MADNERPRLRQPPRVALFYLEPNLLIVRGIARYVREHGPWSIFMQTTAVREHLPAWLAKWQGHGAIGRITDQRTLSLVKRLGIPFVDVRGEFRDPRVPLVHGDDAATGRLAAEHFLERGFRQFGFYDEHLSIQTSLRRQGFVDTVSAAGGGCQAYERPWQSTGPQAWDESEAMVAQWLSGLPKPAAVLASENGGGQRVLSAARRAGIRVPDELAVIGIGHDTALCEVCDPPLSSVVRDFEKQGYKAAELLDKMMNGQAPPRDPILVPPARVITRQSTDVLAIDDRFISAALSFIRRHACDGIGVSDVLREVPLSRSVLQRRFRRIIGQTVGDAVINARLRRAQELLAETDMPLPGIAQVAGFRHQQYMGAVFRRRLGITPARYRKESGLVSRADD